MVPVPAEERWPMMDRMLASIRSTVFNAALSFRLNWEGNFRTFAAQAESSLENPANMHTTVDEVVEKLNADSEMVQQFSEAYGGPPDRTRFLDAAGDFRTFAAHTGKPV